MPVNAILDAQVLLRRGDRILVAKRANTSFMSGHHGLIGGGVEPGESIVEAARREVMEETGLQIETADLRLIHIVQKTSEQNRISFIFATDLASGMEPRNMEPEKCSAMIWAAPEKMPEPLIPYVAFALEKIREGIMWSMFSE
jgi:ADP-ribose pyrophosphatase YjhB (NUDIX family)